MVYSVRTRYTNIFRQIAHQTKHKIIFIYINYGNPNYWKSILLCIILVICNIFHNSNKDLNNI